jgi:hypothetical protein
MKIEKRCTDCGSYDKRVKRKDELTPLRKISTVHSIQITIIFQTFKKPNKRTKKFNLGLF